MRNSKPNPTVRKILLINIILAGIITLGGFATWTAGFVRQSDIQKNYDNQTAIAFGKITPTITGDILLSHYQQGVNELNNKNYDAAITDFNFVLNYQPDYKDNTARLLLSYKTKAEQQVTKLADVSKAPATYELALALVDQQSKSIQAGFQNSPELLGTITYPALVNILKSERAWSQQYAEGNSADSANPDWWDKAITEWEPLYQANPDYLKDIPELAVATRLADTYHSKAVDLCQLKNDYPGAVSAATRALEITYKNKLNGEKAASLQNLLAFINQTQCQVN